MTGVQTCALPIYLLVDNTVVTMRATAVGFAASSLLPARAGELIRPYFLSRHEAISATGAFATVVIERTVDLLTVVALLTVSIGLVDWTALAAGPSVVRALAAWREREAQGRDLPRSRVLRDEVLLDIAAQAPANEDELARTRSVSRSGIAGWMKDGILAAVASARTIPEAELPRLPERRELPRGIGPVVDLLKVLLKMKCDEHDVAQKLVATTADLERVAADDQADVPALHGWRREVFGNSALALKHGDLALTLRNKQIVLIVPDEALPQPAAVNARS